MGSPGKRRRKAFAREKSAGSSKDTGRAFSFEQGVALCSCGQEGIDGDNLGNPRHAIQRRRDQRQQQLRAGIWRASKAASAIGFEIVEVDYAARVSFSGGVFVPRFLVSRGAAL